MTSGFIKHNSDQFNTRSTPVGMPDVFDRLTSTNKSENIISNLSSGQSRIPATVTHTLADESVSSLSPKSTHSYQKPSYGPSGRDNYTDLEFNSKGLHILNLNIRHLLPKLDELRKMLASKNGPDIFGLCETFLNQNISDNLLAIIGYHFL